MLFQTLVTKITFPQTHGDLLVGRCRHEIGNPLMQKLETAFAVS